MELQEFGLVARVSKFSHRQLCIWCLAVTKSWVYAAGGACKGC